MDEDWFEDHDGQLTPELSSLVDIVREAARTWPACPPDHTTVMVFPPELEEDEKDGHARPDDGNARHDAAFAEREARNMTVLNLVVDLSDPGRNLLLKVLGATVAGDWMICSERDQQTLRPAPSEDVTPLEATGTPEELGRLAADWFTEVLRRPMIGADAPSAGQSFVPPDTALPSGHHWVRNAPAAH